MRPSGGGGPGGGTDDHRDPPADGPDPGSAPGEPTPARGSTDAWRRRPADADASPGPEEGPGGPFPSWGALYATVIVWSVGLILLLWLFTATLRVEVAG